MSLSQHSIFTVKEEKPQEETCYEGLPRDVVVLKKKYEKSSRAVQVLIRELDKFENEFFAQYAERPAVVAQSTDLQSAFRNSFAAINDVEPGVEAFDEFAVAVREQVTKIIEQVDEYVRTALRDRGYNELNSKKALALDGYVCGKLHEYMNHIDQFIGLFHPAKFCKLDQERKKDLISIFVGLNQEPLNAMKDRTMRKEDQLMQATFCHCLVM